MRRAKPYAKLVSKQGASQVWEIRWPSSMFKWGKTYVAYVENKELASLRTVANRDVVKPKTAAILKPQVLDALRRAKAIQ